MRCLQCGKGIPLLKRLSGNSEFCSDAHRVEYQREYSQLALGRLMQSHPKDSEAAAVQAPPLGRVLAPPEETQPAAGKDSPPNKALPVANSTTAAVRPGPAAPTAPPMKADGIAKSQPPPVIPVKKAVPLPAASLSSKPKVEGSDPATAKAAPIQKPAPVEPQFVRAAAPEFEHAFASLAPDRPRRQVDKPPAALPQGPVITWESGVEIANSLARPMDRKLDLREVTRLTPTIALDLRIVPPESFETESRLLPVPTEPAVLAEASLWIAAHSDFRGELISLNDFADAQFFKSDFEVAVRAVNAAVSAVPEPLPAPPQVEDVAGQPVPQETHVSLAESQTSASAPLAEPLQAPIVPPSAESVDGPELVSTILTAAVWEPDPEREPLPVNSTGIAPVKAKPLPAFGASPMGAGIIQIPQPNGLPLRPLIVLAAAPPSAPATKGVRNSKADRLSLRSTLSLSAAPNVGLAEQPVEDPTGSVAARMRKILAALTGAAVLGAGVFFFLGKESHAGLKSPALAVGDRTAGSQWIANFATDRKRQRKVSLLRSSLNLPAYRVDFQSSIQIKALGWVYRAQDSRNFYVSKIEFQKPGQNPVYALVHFAVINGVEQPRVETPLHVTVPMGGVYKIRFEAVGNSFTTWVQGQRVEQWTDSRLSSGGAGLYSEGAEQTVLHGEFAVTPL